MDHEWSWKVGREGSIFFWLYAEISQYWTWCRLLRWSRYFQQVLCTGTLPLIIFCLHSGIAIICEIIATPVNFRSFPIICTKSVQFSLFKLCIYMISYILDIIFIFTMLLSFHSVVTVPMRCTWHVWLILFTYSFTYLISYVLTYLLTNSINQSIDRISIAPPTKHGRRRLTM